MKWKSATVSLALVLVGTFVLTRIWYHALVCIPFSERLWSLYNRLYAGTRPNLAYDLELVTVLTVSAAISYGVLRLATFFWARRRRARS